ncbi:MAG: DUF362 domain-containing protein [Pirellulales bacterium]
MFDFPEFFRIRQRFPRPREKDLPGAVRRALDTAGLRSRIQPNQSVALTVGSRGIANIATIARHAVDYCKDLGARPFIVPAMGSHGGATPQGQLGVLERYGVTPDSMGCEIRSSMDVIEVCRAPEGFPVYFDRNASEADHVLVMNRVKSHTRFTGPIESGLMKMMLIGLGKQHGANVYHRVIMNYSFDQIVRSVARVVIDRCKVVGGLAILENGYEETAELVGLPPDKIETGEPELLRRVQAWAPRLPADNIELLIVDRIGKEISGAGMDTNVIGRKYNDHSATGDETPSIHTIYIRGLTHETHGNATGLGIAELCHKRLVDEMDEHSTRMNCLTAGHVTAAMRPLDFPNDREALDNAVKIGGMCEPRDLPAMWIQDTLHIEEIECSRVYYSTLQQRDNVEILTGPRPVEFDSQGDLVPRFS